MSTKKNKSAKSQTLFETAKTLFPGGVHSPVRAFKGVGGTPRFIEKAQGALLTDVDQNTLVDFCMSWGALPFGHSPQPVQFELHQALENGTSFGTAEPYSIELGQKIIQNIPWVEKIRFVNSGTEAVMSALRLARAVTHRKKILKFEGCYHGHVDSLLVKAGSGLAEMPQPDSAGISEDVASTTILLPLDDEAQIERCFALHGADLAAVIIEPLPANNGLLIQRKEWIHFLVQKARDHGTLVIFDEVISGFRTSFKGMAEYFGIQSDLVTYGKIIGGGFPVGAYGGKAIYMNRMAPQGDVYQAGTLSANPIAMIAGRITLDMLLDQNPYALLNDRIEKLSSHLQLELRKHRFKTPFQLIHFGSVFWPYLGKGNPPRTPQQIAASHKEVFPRFFHLMLDQGFYLSPSAYEVGFLSLAHTETQLTQFSDAVLFALKELEADV